MINWTFASIFFRVCKTDYVALKKMLDATLHSESDYKKAKEIIKSPADAHDAVTRAWAFWVQNNMTFAHKILGGFAFARDAIAQTTAKRIDAFSNELCDRLRNVQIFNRDALDIIKRFDAEDTFFYLDPPYANSDCGHYEKGKEVFYDLLELLLNLRGKWLLSSYPCDELSEIWQKKGIYHEIIDKPLSISGKKNAGKRKQECLTYNYELK